MAHATRPATPYAAWLAEGKESPANRAVGNPVSLGVGADLIGFGGGQPAAEAYPLQALERAYSGAILKDGRAVLPYGPAQGELALREIVAERLAKRGMQVDPERVVILSGSIQGLHLVGRITLNHGDTILTEAPTFMGALAAWEHQQPRYLSIPVDEHGMQLDVLEQALSRADQQPRFMYLLPTFQNPMGVSMSLERRRRVLEIAQQLTCSSSKTIRTASSGSMRQSERSRRFGRCLGPRNGWSIWARSPRSWHLDFVSRMPSHRLT